MASPMLVASCSCWRSMANHALGRNHVAEIRPRERLAGDIREHHPIAPGKRELPLKRRPRLTHQRGIGLQQPANPERVLLRLLQRIRLPHLAPIDLKRGREPAHYARKDGDEVGHMKCGDLAGMRMESNRVAESSIIPQ